MTNFAIGAIAAAIIGLVGYRMRALTLSGAGAAFAVGTLTYGFGGLAFASVLLVFFLTSILLGRIGRPQKKALIDVGKTGARDGWQVLANGGVATLCICVSGLLAYRYGASGLARGGWTEYPALSFTFDSFYDPNIWMTAFCGAYAAATADTWGTEIGTIAKQMPRSILTFAPIAKGLSGGVTIAGTLAEAAGALFIGVISLVAFVFGFGIAGIHLAPDRIAIAIVAGGIAGALVDSLLGASTQELRHCPACDRACETNPHVCGSPTSLVRGAAWFSNDLVNFAATVAGAGTAFIIAAV
jgi:uncharacterized membrane protein